MQAYQVDSGDERSIQYVATLTDAKAIVKDEPAPFRAGITIELVDVQSDKAGMIFALNRNPVVKELGRSWRGTASGGLTETTDQDV